MNADWLSSGWMLLALAGAAAALLGVAAALLLTPVYKHLVCLRYLFSGWKAVVPLVSALLDVESSVRSAATATLQKLDRHWEQNEGVRQVVPKIINTLKHPDYWVRYSASKLLELLKIDPNNLPAELPSVMPDKPVAEVLPHPAVGVLADMLFDRDRDLRLAAAGALGRLREKSAGSILTAALRDSDYAVRQAVQTALAALN